MKLKNGYNQYSKEDDNYKMLLDVGVLRIKKNETYSFSSNEKEKAILIWSGKVKVKITQDNKEIILERKSIWEDPAMAIHGSRDTNFVIEAINDSELLLQAKTNGNSFSYKLYDKSNCKVSVVGNNYKPSTSVRYIIDIFNYSNEPHSNMVLGEVFTKTGHWSGYPPHKHDQPEMYIYNFNKPQGFGIGILDEKAKIVHNYDSICIPGATMHQNSCAPGYQMYFVWMISHLPNNPWQIRHHDENHEWINQPNLKIDDTKEILIDEKN